MLLLRFLSPFKQSRISVQGMVPPTAGWSSHLKYGNRDNPTEARPKTGLPSNSRGGFIDNGRQICSIIVTRDDKNSGVWRCTSASDGREQDNTSVADHSEDDHTNVYLRT